MIDTLIESGFAKENRNMTACIYFFNEFTKQQESNFSNCKLIC